MGFLFFISIIIISGIAIASILVVRVFMPRQIVKELEEYENVLARRQFAEVQNTYYEMRGWRHDYKNHMQVLKIYVENRQWEECIDYISQINEDLNSVDHVIKTGNIMADAIVNSKVSLAKSKDISLDITAKVPVKLPVSDVEFCVLFGNLMDNAIEACEKINPENKRFIRVYTGIFKRQFYISVTNSTDSKERVGRYFSLKGEGHGFGLYRIDKIVKERNGYINRKDEPGVFATEIMLPFVT